MARLSRSLSAFACGGLVVAGCSSTVPIGQDGTDSGGTSEDGSADSPSSSSGASSSSSGAGSSSGGTSSSSGGGACCPAGYSMMACTYPDGGSGFSCHNPALGCASSTTCGQGCDQVVTGQCGGASSSGGGSSSSGGSGPHWYSTCGDPSCPAPTGDGGPLTDDGGVPCPAVGSSCSVQGEKCGTPNANVNCGAVVECATQDPKKGVGGCPLSSRKFKDGIEYLGGAGLQELHDETLQIRLATYNYKDRYGDPNPKHLGFIIEDNPPQSPAVQWSRDRVDMYGYLSMVVATMQVQEKEIEGLRRELAESRADACR